ncbi:cold shock domain-containing protein [Marinospirillum sp.]|uniref:cold-shock protein n=1 Tax=Marinospirillum sp. TaxID=2183934 RepID=UPI0028708291|nr:cold shock domain-containing protein [Marinospirillum sp.]MDR9468201.1 cold shock domain-containing protein [Marinospirillum sp.]
MLNNTLIRNILVSLVIAVLAPLVLPFLAVSPEAAASGSSAVKTYLLVFVLLMLAASVNEFLRLKALGIHADSDEVDDADEEADDDREEGVVKWFNVNKGFGFIIRDVGGEVFVHFRSIRGTGHRTLREGQRVRFAAAEGEKGLQAEDVSILNH